MPKISAPGNIASNVELKNNGESLLKLSEGLLSAQPSKARHLAGLLILEALARRGDAWAAWKMADRLYQGEGIRRKRKDAMIWYRYAAHLGSAGAHANLGVLAWERGRESEAIRHYRAAARMGDMDATHNLGLILFGRTSKKNQQSGLKLLKRAANAGHPNAMHKLATGYLYGTGVHKSARLALRWFETASKAGSVEAKKFLRSLDSHRTRVGTGN